MAEVDVDISDRAIIRVLNTPGGAVWNWRNERRSMVLNTARTTSPVNDPADAAHRGGVVGVYKASWKSRISGSNQHRLRFVVWNTAGHAEFVEFGRRGSSKHQIFPGVTGDMIDIGAHFGGTKTKARPGRHILRNAVNGVGASTGDWSPTL